MKEPSVGSDFNGDALNEIITTVNEIDQLTKETHLSTDITINPKKYECDICEESFVDYGIHMCITHKMLKCDFVDHKNMFFSCLYELRNHQNEFHMDETIDCFNCNEIFSNNYCLVMHCKSVHEVDFCIFCQSFTENKSEFDSHMRNHIISNIEILRIKSNIPILFSEAFATIKKVQSISVVTCYLCSMQFGISIFMRHFQNIHHVKNPSVTLFPLFDGMSFSFKTLDCDNTDDWTISDTGSPNNPSIVYMETFEVLENTKDASEKSYQEKVFDNCNVCCQISGKRGNIFRRHVIVDHPDLKFSNCQIDKCEFIFFELDEFKEHEMKNHAITKKQDWTMLEADDNSRDNYDEINDNTFGGMTNNQNGKILNPCSQCEKLFKSPAYLFEHFKQIHIKIDRMHPCDKCGKQYRNQFERNAHQIQRHSGRNIPCLTCGKLFESLEDVRIHARSHTSIKAYSCQFCTKSFYQSSIAMTHIRKFHKRDFENYLQNKTHVGNRVESDINRYYKQSRPKKEESENMQTCVCKMCGKSCNSRKILRDHMAYIHCEERNYPCIECDKKFKTHTNREAHIQRIHKKSDVKFNCDICNKEFKFKGDRTKHLQVVHAEKSLACSVPTCFKFFKREIDVRMHMVIHTSIKAFTCQYCNKSFNQNSNMWTHIKRAHFSEPLVKAKYSFDIGPG